MTRYAVLFILLLNRIFTFSQNTCNTADFICHPGTYTYQAVTGMPNAQAGPDYGCLYATPNASWHYINISNSGTFDFLIEGQTQGISSDIDFICWGPFFSLDNVCDSLTASTIIDCSYSGSYSETLNIPTGVSGEYYLVLITNFSNSNQFISFTQSGGTGFMNCSYTHCAGNYITVQGINPANLATPNYTVLPGGQTSNTGYFYMTPLTSTAYTVLCSGINSQNIPLTTASFIFIDVLPAPSISITASQSPVCSGQSATLSASGGTGYLWDTGGRSDTSIVSPLVTTIYSVTGAGTNHCSASTTFTLAVAPGPTVSIYNNKLVSCDFEPVTLNATGAAGSYSWDTQATGASIIVTPSVSTNYTVKGFDLNNCYGTATFRQNVEVCTGIKLNSDTHTSKIYPNPTTGYFFIELDEDAFVTVYNSTGESVFTEIIKPGKSSFNLQDEVDGLYIITVQQNKKYSIFKLVKQ